ncbi:MAG: hypothetical protein WCL00_05180 [Bacteroidota bacterium]
MSTPQEIYNKLALVKASNQELKDYVTNTSIPGSVRDDFNTLATDLKSQSKVANWRLFLWIMAYASWLVEITFGKHKVDIANLLAAKRPHTLRWYSEESKKFQYGYAFTWKDDTYVYATDDPDARIIKYAAASEKNGKVVLKVAKEVSGAKAPLTNTEKTVFTEYWRKWRDAGVKVEIISQSADLLKITVTIVRDRLVLDATNHLLRDATINPIQQSIDNYGANLEFDGKIIISKLVDAIQAAEGVVDIKLTAAHVQPSGGSWTAVDMSVEAASGYFILSYTDSVMTFVDNITVETIQ